ncbi:nitrile hydratase accessory protein [Stappia sp. ES.058]|uniref:nitrile hydratase accessory protein n=1 Tax=Stappia sp. ES.058 TaxID=1881061 RepID=UPI0018D27F4C|nr:nitrile hydratase accessory protein [Stappia sp. ES.058]
MQGHPRQDLFADLPRARDEPVFHAPWEARAFALAVSLHAKGLFTWSEWADTLAGTIKQAQAGGDPDCGDSYYRHWLTALERLVTEREVTTRARLDARREAWERAAVATPHGEPIELGRDGQPVPPA